MTHTETARLSGKVALVTGGASGIGKAVCERFAAEGARVVVADLDGERCARVAEAIGPHAWGVALDVTSQDSIEEAVRFAIATAGKIDILVNAAGIYEVESILEISRERTARVFQVNIEGVIFMTQAVARHMVERGEGGRIINFSSQAGRRGEGPAVAYCASKAAVISITQSCALELIRYGINVNAIAPGVVDTPMWDEVDALFAKYEGRPPGEKKRLVGEGVPFGRMGKPEDHVGCAVFLAAPESDYVVAQTFNVDGGQWMS